MVRLATDMVKVGDVVEFEMPVEGKSIGAVKSKNGAYVYIEVQLEEVAIEIERYENEVKVLEF